MRQPIPGMALASVLALSAGCASTVDTDVSNDLAVAESTIAQAEEAGATSASQSELATAREKLDEARRLANEGEGERAQRLAQQAILEAELAAAKARRAETADAVERIEENLAILRQETLNDQGE